MREKKMTAQTLLLVLISVALGVCGQLLLKHGTNTFGADVARPLGVLSLLLHPPVIAGFVCYGAASLSWLVVLTRAPVSVAYPMLSLGYAVVAVVSWRLFGEAMTASKVLGILLIISGVVFLTRS